MNPTTCATCGAELVEVSRWTITRQDFERSVREQAGRPPSPSELHRFEHFGIAGGWREVACSANPDHTGFLAERIPE